MLGRKRDGLACEEERRGLCNGESQTKPNPPRLQQEGEMSEVLEGGKKWAPVEGL